MDQKIHRLLDLRKLEIFKFQSITNVHSEGQQRNCHFGNNASCIILDICVISANVYHSTQHKYLLCKTLPWRPGEGSC